MDVFLVVGVSAAAGGIATSAIEYAKNYNLVDEAIDFFRTVEQKAERADAKLRALLGKDVGMVEAAFGSGLAALRQAAFAVMSPVKVAKPPKS